MAIGERYQESGKFTVGGAAITAACAIVAGVIGGFVYGVIDQVNPFIYINALGSIFAGVFAAMGATLGATMGKVRNGKVVAASAVLGGVACLWAAWVGWFYALSDWELFLASSPDGLWAFIQIVNIKGAWSLKGSTPTGGFLWFVWGCEALLILGTSFVGGAGGLGDSPFCEDCGVWADKETRAILQTPADVEGLTKGMAAGDFTALAALAKGDDKGVTWIEAKVEACPRQGAPYYLTVVGKARTKNAKGEEEISEFQLVKLLEVDKETADIVATGGAEVVAAAAGDDAEKAKDEESGGEETVG